MGRPRRVRSFVTGHQWVYVIERADGVIKIGTTVMPAERQKTHARELRKIGTSILRCHYIQADDVEHGRRVECCALHALDRMGGKRPNAHAETFTGVTFEQAIAAVRAAV